MFFRILKNDLKRKKTMNVILLLFVVLSSMFAAAAVNNIIAVTGGIENYFDAANVPEIIVSVNGVDGIEEEIKALPSTENIKTEHWLTAFSSKYFKHKGKKLDNFINPAYFISESEMAINYFDEDNKIIESVDKGCFYANNVFTNNTDISVGDDIEINIGDSHRTLKYMGRFKGALFSPDTMASAYIILDSEDYDYFDKEDAAHILNVSCMYVNSTDQGEIKELADKYDSVSFSTRDDMKSIYFYDMLSAYIIMMISIVLMITAFVVLRFTIGFTISEEFREIGVMKAVGIGSGSIRGIYLIKYFAISVAGAIIGFFASMPLSDMMLKTVSENMVFNSNSSKLMGIISSVAVVIIIVLFCYGCTRKINKYSPIDAVRNGQTGERFHKKSVLHLGRSKLPSTAFLSLNDIISAPKQFSIIIVIFTLCMLLMTLMSNFELTLRSEKILHFFSVPESDAHMLDSETLGEMFSRQDAYMDIINDIEKQLDENDMPGKCSVTANVHANASHGDKTSSIQFLVTKGNIDHKLVLDSGSAPAKNDEIAVTTGTLKKLDAEIGDRITAVFGDKEYEFIITGTYSSFIGNSAFLYKDFDTSDAVMGGSMGLQIRFDGNPDKEQIEKNIDKMREVFESDKIYNTSDFIKNFTAMSDTLNAAKQMMMILTVIVTIMIVVLIERSFISKEKSEIALMKAVGIKSSSMIIQHILRFVTVAVLACVISSAVLMPVSNLLMGIVCNMIGDIMGIKCDLNPVEVFAVCPAILISVTAVGSWLTALYTKTVKASDTASIE